MKASSCAGLTVLMAVLSFGWHSAGADNAPQKDRKATIKQIQAAWEVRQKKIKTARVKWKETHIYSAGFMSDMWKCLGPRTTLINPHNLTVPPQTTTLEVTGALVIDKDRYRYDYYMPAWSKKQQKMIATPCHAVTSRGRQVGFSPEGEGDKRYPYGRVSTGRNHIDPGVPQLRAIAMSLTPLIPTLQVIYLSSYRIAAQQVLVKDIGCFELSIHYPGILPAYEKFYLDPAKDYNVVRHDNLSTDKTTQTLNVNYQQLNSGLWVPSSWKLEVRRPSKATYLLEGEVTDIVVNGKVDSATFSLDFPPGTLVNDSQKKQRYMVRSDGSKRVFQRSELADKDYQQLKEIVDAEYAQSRSVRRRVIAGVLLVGSILALSWYLYRRAWCRPVSQQGKGPNPVS